MVQGRSVITDEDVIPTDKIFLCALSYAYVTKTLAMSYSKSMITQIERRFNIPASLVGVIDGSFEIGNLLVIAFVSYFGAKFHRPRVIAVGCVIMSLGCCLAALPHFLMNRYQYERTVSSSANSTSHISLCMANQSHISDRWVSEECKSGSESLMWIFVLMGNILRGIGETPVEPLGLSYVDDFAKVENSPFYIGIIQTVSIIGPLLGSLMASYCAQLYVDIGFINLDDVTISLTDARWVGAWWSGYLISGIVNLLAAIPFWFLPKSLPKEGHEDQPDLEETMEPIRKENHEKKSPENNKDILKEFPRFLKNLFNNKVYLLYVIITVLQFNGFIGFISFLPKFVEQQYGKSASEAIFLIAVYSLPVICVGYFLGGFFMKKYKVTRYQAAKIGLLSSVLDYLTFMAAYAMICKNSSVAGLTISYEGIEEVSYLDHLKSGCNINCDCPTDVWDPVCGDNGVAYVSACLAGCQSSTGTWQNMTFQNCSCIAASSLSSNATAVLGQCAREENCDTMLLYFMILTLVTCFIYSSGAIPGYMVLIRSLKPEEKSLGLGLHLLAARAFAGITSPIYYGAIIDTTCIKWGTTSCGEPGACRMYDSDAFRYIYYGVTAALRGVSYIPCLLIMIILKREDRRNENSSSDKEAVEIKLEETSLNA